MRFSSIFMLLSLRVSKTTCLAPPPKGAVFGNATSDDIRRILHENRRIVEQRQRSRRVDVSPTGNRKWLALLMYFPEDASSIGNLPTRDYINTLLNGLGTSSINPAGSAREWLLYNSFTKLDRTFDVLDWSPTQRSARSYANGNAGREDLLNLESIFSSKLDQLDNQGFDFTPFITDGYLNVAAFHSGFPAELGSAACLESYLDRIWSQGVWGASEESWKSRDASVSLGSFVVSSVIARPACSSDTSIAYTPSAIAIFAHESMHSLANLPDLYDGNNDGSGVGSFDVMGHPYGWNDDSARPGYLGPFSKMEAGYLTPIEILVDGFYAIQPSELSAHVYVISSPYPDGEYLLIENRIGYRWSDDWSGSGIVIWHIDLKADGQQSKGYPGLSGWPRAHYQVAVLQADGNYDIEKGNNVGDAGDFFVKDSVLAPFSLSGWPNTDSYQNGQSATGLTIRVTTDPQFIMQFEVRGMPRVTGSTTGFAPGWQGPSNGGPIQIRSEAGEDAVGTKVIRSGVSCSPSDFFWIMALSLLLVQCVAIQLIS